MSYTANMTDPATGRHYFPYPYSVIPLPHDMKHSIASIGTLALMSVISTSILLLFLSYRCITWRMHYNTYIGYNQYVMLVMCLLLADLQQSAGFIISFHWLRYDEIVAPSRACFAQGWLIHSGDVASGFFVLTIAVHTWYSTVCGRRLSTAVFYSAMACVWLFAYALTAAGVIWHREEYFVRAGAWCWVSAAFESDRLAFHYIWIFIVEFGTVVIYIIIWVTLRRKIEGLPGTSSSTRIAKITKLMMWYPVIYVTLTLPLAVGRMWSMTHHGQSAGDTYQVVAGSLITSCGWVDSLLYTLTRKSLLKSSMPGAGSAAQSRIDWDRNLGSRGITHTRTVTIAGSKLGHRSDGSSQPEEPDHDLAELCPGTKHKSDDTSDRCGNLPHSQALPWTPKPARMVDPWMSGRTHGLGDTKAETKVEISAGELELGRDEESFSARGIPTAPGENLRRGWL